MENEAYSLFNETAFGEKAGSKCKSLKIAPGRDKSLSKRQQMFNKLTKRIEQLQKSISKRRATKKQSEREERRKQDEILTQKSMRSIYLSLAKALHPDTIMDPAEKARKEELMKKVTAAYADKDLPALLKLEMEWVASEQAALGTLPDDVLKLYIAALKEQVAALEQEHDALYYHPRFMDLLEFARYPETTARQLIREQANDYARAIDGFTEIHAIFALPAPKKEIMAFVKDYREVADFRGQFSEDFPTNIF